MSNRTSWDRKPHGTVAAYRRHYRLGEKPCGARRQAQALLRAEDPRRDAYNAIRRERYAAARAAGFSSAEALRVRDQEMP